MSSIALATKAELVLGVLLTFLTAWLLSRTILRGEVSTFSLELPPYRPPRVLQTLYTSLIDRTLFVLWRAIVFAAPAGAVIWLLSNVTVGGTSLAGGQGKIFGTFIGALILSVIQNGMNLTKVESKRQLIVFGALILIAVLLDRLETKGSKAA